MGRATTYGMGRRPSKLGKTLRRTGIVFLFGVVGFVSAVIFDVWRETHFRNENRQPDEYNKQKAPSLPVTQDINAKPAPVVVTTPPVTQVKVPVAPTTAAPIPAPVVVLAGDKSHKVVTRRNVYEQPKRPIPYSELNKFDPALK